jgi:thioredoxin-dependent peroxiredoxin
MPGLMRILVTSAAAAAVGLWNALTVRTPADQVRLEPGDDAPDFELPGSDGRTHRLSEFRGRRAVVLAWFPKAFTGGCTAECEALGASSAALGAFDAQIFGVSTDRPETNRAFAASMGIDYPILSDPLKTVARRYGVVGRSGYPSRWTFYIGHDGRILDVDRRVRVTSHGSDVAERLESLNVKMKSKL